MGDGVLTGFRFPIMGSKISKAAFSRGQDRGLLETRYSPYDYVWSIVVILVVKTSVIVLVTPSIYFVMAEEQSLLAYLCKENPKLIRDNLKEGPNRKPSSLRERSSSKSPNNVYWDPPVYN